MSNRDVPVWNAMITGYKTQGDMKAAMELFDSMPRKNVISWTTVISGFSQNGNYDKALTMFLCMEKDKSVKPNHITVVSVLPACANLGELEIGRRLEGYARQNGFFDNIFVSNATLEMYSKCGMIDVAKQIFDEMGNQRNLCSWNSMIGSLATHGKHDEALTLYSQMLELHQFCYLRSKQKAQLEYDRRQAEAAKYADGHWKIRVKDPRFKICIDKLCNWKSMLRHWGESNWTDYESFVPTPPAITTARRSSLPRQNL